MSLGKNVRDGRNRLPNVGLITIIKFSWVDWIIATRPEFDHVGVPTQLDGFMLCHRKINLNFLHRFSDALCYAVWAFCGSPL